MKKEECIRKYGEAGYERRLQQTREWRDAHKKEGKIYNQKYQEEHSEEISIQKQEYYKKHSKEKKAYGQKYREKYPKKVKENNQRLMLDSFGQPMMSPTNLRIGVCEICGQVCDKSKNQFDLHHLANDSLIANCAVMELCRFCHRLVDGKGTKFVASLL